MKEITEFTVEELCLWLPRFLCEIRRKDKTHYRAKSVFEFLLCVQSLFEVRKGVKMKFLKDSRFLSIRNAVNNIMKDLQRKGFGTNPRKADIISEITEELLWTKGLLGVEPSQKLLQTVVWLPYWV